MYELSSSLMPDFNMNQEKEAAKEGNARFLLKYIKKKYPGLTLETAHTIITRVKKANGGFLLELTKKLYHHNKDCYESLLL